MRLCLLYFWYSALQYRYLVRIVGSDMLVSYDTYNTVILHRSETLKRNTKYLVLRTTMRKCKERWGINMNTKRSLHFRPKVDVGTLLFGDRKLVPFRHKNDGFIRNGNFLTKIRLEIRRLVGNRNHRALSYVSSPSILQRGHTRRAKL